MRAILLRHCPDRFFFDPFSAYKIVVWSRRRKYRAIRRKAPLLLLVQDLPDRRAPREAAFDRIGKKLFERHAVLGKNRIERVDHPGLP